MEKKKLQEIAIVRSVAMLMVICIHFLNLPQLYLLRGSNGQGFYILWRSLLVCAVPCFMFLSMLMISYHMREKERFQTVNFYKKRVYRIVIPYLVWSIIYLLFYYKIGYYDLEDFSEASNWIYWLGYGKANEHLYFMTVMCQFYLITPLMYPLAKRYRNSFVKAILIGILPQIAIYWANRLYIHTYYTMLTSSAAWYWSIGFLGLWFGFEYERNLLCMKKHLAKIIMLNMILLGIHLFYSIKIWHQLWEVVSFDTFFYTLNMYGYMLVSILSILMASIVLSRIFESHPENKIMRFLSETSRYSYGIYLMHPLLMAVLRKILVISNPYLWFFIIIISVPLVAYSCGVITKYAEKIPVICYAFGVSQKKHIS